MSERRESRKEKEKEEKIAASLRGIVGHREDGERGKDEKEKMQTRARG